MPFATFDQLFMYSASGDKQNAFEFKKKQMFINILASVFINGNRKVDYILVAGATFPSILFIGRPEIPFYF